MTVVRSSALAEAGCYSPIQVDDLTIPTAMRSGWLTIIAPKPVSLSDSHSTEGCFKHRAAPGLELKKT